MRTVLDWFDKQLEDKELMMLLAFLLIVFVLLGTMGSMLAPLLVAIGLAYVLDGIVSLLVSCKMPRLLAVILVGTGALLTVMFAMLAIMPVLSEQIGQLVSKIPQYVQLLKDTVHDLQQRYPTGLNAEYLQQAIASGAEKVQEWSGLLLSKSLSSIPNMIALGIYVFLVPVMVFFLLKDKQRIQSWAQQFLPEKRTLLNRVWGELDVQMGNYIRGRFWESSLVGLVMWVVYVLMGHEYALLLAVLTGISVWIPFVGAAVVTIPVVLLSYFQWGWTDMAMYSLMAYAIIQLIDANIVIPWLFSEVVNLHPVAIIVAVLVFGSFWGVVGVFFAIPLAALVQSVLVIIAERTKQSALES
ncbi:MAG TPA: AI-2E family transporter [Ghiorsea sp.]|nr:AI-2E family transporter [Ghiorsea sp.]HIP07711.1 AI-2E family transporter [Mariprofundaceae bacterium]